MNAKIPDKLKNMALEALSEDMQRDASPIRRELDTLILEAQARSIKEPASYEK